MFVPPRICNEKLTGIKLERINQTINLEYITNGNVVTPGAETRPELDEEMIHKRNVAIDVMDGYDPNLDASINQHSIYHLYEYEYQTRFLDDIPRSQYHGFYEIKSRFLCCRYVICGIDDYMTKKKPLELFAIRRNGDIYIGSNKSSDNSFPNEAAKEAAFGGLNFPKKVTKGGNSQNLNVHHSVVRQFNIRNQRSQKSMTIFISSVVRAFDKNEDVVELKTIGNKTIGKLENLQGLKARSWWLRALLSGARRIVYGVRKNDMTINEIHEATIEDFTTGHFQFKEGRLFNEVFKIFEKIDKVLDHHDMCLINLNPFQPMSVKITSSESLKKSPFW
ncbi:unnamed protein product [Caenorhabditis brenneri]